ncbi:MAG: RNA-binding S4 domain-containing protein [Francisellaceae bacterium]|jgi:ribosome-associated heat shock protein Hsp15|nr:RNA-binding S4 domain-containing protein [Francisellaceae bacterium]MBT6207580.1 RNA-binding S4 domain-containing protein [Francisellaceae bacterium]MBT6538716.1 RNA-binding S4 domain-containing protein [Francisellaceae bacterium]
MGQDVHFHIEFDSETVPAETSWIPNEGDNSRNNKDSDQKLTVRLDKWLWAARFFKTRALARAAVEKGKVSYNGQPSKASREIELGDKVKIHQGKYSKELVIIGLSTRRRNAEEAQLLYKETQVSSCDEGQEHNKRPSQHNYRLNRSHKMHAATPFMPAPAAPSISRRIEVRGKSSTSVRFLRRNNGKNADLHTNSCFLQASEEL